jgi:hypothetical protein
VECYVCCLSDVTYIYSKTNFRSFGRISSLEKESVKRRFSKNARLIKGIACIEARSEKRLKADHALALPRVLADYLVTQIY